MTFSAPPRDYDQGNERSFRNDVAAFLKTLLPRNQSIEFGPNSGPIVRDTVTGDRKMIVVTSGALAVMDPPG